MIILFASQPVNWPDVAYSAVHLAATIVIIWLILSR